MSRDEEKFDGLFMNAIQHAQGIHNFYEALFSFMRRKTDFFQQEETSMRIVQEKAAKHLALYKEDMRKKEMLQKKAAEEKAKKEAAKTAGSGATVEEIDEDEAMKIELENLRKRQEEAKKKKEADKAAGKEEKKEDSGDEDEEAAEKTKKEKEALLQKPNSGNGGYTEKYVWNQTLEEVTAFIKLPPGTTAKMLKVDIQMSKVHVSLKSNPSEPLLDGKWCKKVHAGDSYWSVERDGDKCTLNIQVEKYDHKTWWKCLVEGDVEINTQAIEPENSKLSDLDQDTRATVEKMMFDQQQKQKGLPTSEELEKQNKLKAFMDAHPEMDFSKAKFC